MRKSFEKCRSSWLVLVALVAGTTGLIAGAATNGGPGEQIGELRASPEQQQALDTANSMSQAFRTVANHVLPAVVAIENTQEVASAGPANRRGGGQVNPFEGTPFEDLFRGQGPGGSPFDPGTRAPVPRSGLGSGVVIDPSGIILTNNHVVAGSGTVTVRTQDGREFVATDVLTDPKTDIAVVKIEGADDLVAARLGDSQQVEIGDWVLALGQPFGLESSVTAGIISAKHRGLGIADRENFLQTDAAINPGNSGGPLVNLKGEIVGINTAISSRSGGNVGIGFAVPANLARWVSDQLVKTGTVRRAYLGVGIQPLTPALAGKLNVPPRSGVVVTDVFDDTPAARAGLQTSDVITKFAGTPVNSPQQLQLVVERSELNKEHPIEIIRDGEKIELAYTATELPEDFGVAERRQRPAGDDEAARMNEFGFAISPLDDDVAERLELEDIEGVLVTSVQKGGAADQAGLEPGMVITHVDRKPVPDVEAFRKAAEASEGDGILLLVRTESGSRFVVIKPQS